MPDIEKATRAYDGLDRDNLYTIILSVHRFSCTGLKSFRRRSLIRTVSYTSGHSKGDSGLLTRIAAGMVRQSEWNDAAAKWETVV